MNWQQWAMFAFGAARGIAVMAACATSGYCERQQESARLRGALDELLQAVKRCPTLTGEHNRALDLAAKRARKVLGER